MFTENESNKQARYLSKVRRLKIYLFPDFSAFTVIYVEINTNEGPL
jgi:hypothetical protein